MARVYARIPKKLFMKAKKRARERGLVKPSGKENISGYLRQLVREDAKEVKNMREVDGEFLERVAEYLDLGYTPEWVEVEDWRGQNCSVQSLIISWSDGNQVHTAEANQNLDEPVQCWDYEN